ncbi:NAD(P)-binding domain-containing protein [Pseudochrobactrum sp. HB0163]|uniref:NAD(P)-binding domain-containing protein n=1 Tax=Pseudochrobactrum sp. HB0163 TaxID=3450708 RepID=UPI003F6E242E
MQNFPSSLEELNKLVARDLDYLTLPAKEWVPVKQAAGKTLLDVAIIGGGMAGLAAAASLKHLGIRTVIFDARPKGFEGPWATTARMETLRSPKSLTGPAIGIPSLTFRAWFTAQFGADEWERLDKIPRLQWMDYLRWYREVLNIELCNEHHISMITPQAGFAVLDVETPQGSKIIYARHVVLATGRDGLGGPYVPEIIRTLPKQFWAHSSDENDYSLLRGKAVAVIGAGASAMDSAATALEAGAARVDLLIRRKDIPRINRGKGMGNPGSVYGMQNLDDRKKLAIYSYIGAEQVPPPRASVLRVSRHENAFFQLGASLEKITVKGDKIEITTPKGRRLFDFVIASTGFRIDWQQKAFLAKIAGKVRIWAERLAPLNGDEDRALTESPDLGPAFEFLPKAGVDAEGLSRIHCFCYPAMMSHGAVSGDIPSISEGAQRLSQGICATLYQEDIDTHFANARNYGEPEVFGDEWAEAAHYDQSEAGALA